MGGTIVLGTLVALSLFTSGAAAQIPDPTQVTGTATQAVSNVTQQASGTVQQTTSSPTQTVHNTTTIVTQPVKQTSSVTQPVKPTTSGATQPVSTATHTLTGSGQQVTSPAGSAPQQVTAATSGVRKSGANALARGGKARQAPRRAGVVIPNARPIPANCGQALRLGPIALAHWMATFKGLGGGIGYRSTSSPTSGSRPFTGGPQGESAPQAVPRVPLPEAPSESDGRVLTLWLIIGAVLVAALGTYLSGQQMVTGSWNPFRRD